MHPQIDALKKAIWQFSSNRRLLAFYADLHAIAKSEISFMHANYSRYAPHLVKSMIVPHLMEHNSLHFSFAKSQFTTSNRHSVRDDVNGSARIELFKEHPYCSQIYSLEVPALPRFPTQNTIVARRDPMTRELVAETIPAQNVNFFIKNRKIQPFR